MAAWSATSALTVRAATGVRPLMAAGSAWLPEFLVETMRPGMS
jgi:hypothetical protein